MKSAPPHKKLVPAGLIACVGLVLAACADKAVEAVAGDGMDTRFADAFGVYADGEQTLVVQTQDALELRRKIESFPYRDHSPFAAQVSCVDMDMEIIRPETPEAFSASIYARTPFLDYWLTRANALCRSMGDERRVKQALRGEYGALQDRYQKILAAGFEGRQ